MLILHPPVITSQDGKARITGKIEENGEIRELWFEVEESNRIYLPADTLDAWVVACLLPAMMQGKDMAVKGAMSSKLFYNLTHLLITTLREYLPAAKSINISADRLLTSYVGRATGVISGFSGGVDSFCNYYDHSGEHAPPEFRITHFVYNNVGSHGQCGPERDYAVFKAHAAALRKFAAEENKPLITVNSNLDDFIGMNFQLTHTIRNVTVALLLQKVASKFLYPSCSQIRYTEVAPSHDIAGLDPIILPLLSTEKMDCIASGGQYTRTEKAACVADMPASWRYLDVCVEPYNAKPGQINCSRCWKCMRSQMTFDALGKLENYREVFDLDEYRKYKNIFLVDVLKSSNNHQEDLADLIRRTNYPIPLGVRLLCMITPRYLGRRIARRLIPRLAAHQSVLGALNTFLCL